MNPSKAVIFGAVLTLSVGATATAQQRRPEPAGPGTVIGFVVDGFGRGIDNADVYILELKRRVTSDTAGYFRFDSIPDGDYQLAARRIGYFAVSRKIRMEPGGVVASLRLAPITRTLPSIVTSASRGGLSGIVADSNSNVIKGAVVEVIGESRRAETDSAGFFQIKVPTGRHMVKVSASGYATKMVSATVPTDSGRQIMVWLSTGDNNAAARMDFNMKALHERLIRRTAVSSALITREDINKHGWTDLSQIARSAWPVDDNCRAIVDGGPRSIEIWALKAEDIETVEAYFPKPTRYTATNTRSGANARQAPRPTCIPVYVWLRR